jgi:MHS family proline/betaine transporter-like MFS transporter
MPGALTMLISLRVLSGISAGGEAAGVNTYMSEIGGQDKDHTIVAAVGVNNVSGALAFFLANLVSLGVHRFPKDMQLAWAWRIPFLLAAPLALVSIYLRRQMKETEEFEVAHRDVDEENNSDSKNGDRAVAESRSAAKEANATFGFVRGLILCVIVQGASVSWNYFPVYLSSWLSKNAGFTPTAALMMTGTSKIVQLLMTFPCSAFGDGFGATVSMILGNILAAIFTLPVFLLLIHACGASGDMAADAEHHNGADIVAFIVVGVLLPIFSSFFVVPGMLFVNCLFPTNVRARGAGFGYGLAAVLGGFTPMICDGLAEHRAWYPALFITCLTLPSLAALVWSRSAHARGALLVYRRPWLF